MSKLLNENDLPGLVNINSATSHGASVVGSDEVLIADINDSNNIKKTTAQDIADLGSGGSAVAVDLANDSNDEITDLTRINTTSDSNNIITNNTGSEILVDMSSNWPTADNVVEANVDHDSLNNFVSNEHVDHSGVSITAGTALSGGGDITTSRTLNYNGSLSDQSDASISTPSAGEVPIYHGTNSQFENASITGGTEISISQGDASITINSDFTPSSTDTLTNKTLDADGTGNSISNIGANETKLGDGLEADGSDNIKTEEMYSFTIPTDQWAAGLSNAEIGRKVLQSGETLVIDRIELHEDGGGASNANMSVRVQDVTAATTIGSTNLNTVTKNPGSSGTANTIAIQITNSTGSQVNANVEVTGRVTGA